MAGRIKFASHEEYMEAASESAQPVLLRIQELVETLLPQACRCVSYNMPAYRDGKVFFYFAAFKNHIGIYPPIKHDADLINELAPYRNEKGNLLFRFDEPIPYELIGKVAKALADDYARR